MSKIFVANVTVALVAATSGLLAQSGSIRLVPPTAPGVRFAQPWRPTGLGSDTKIIGTVIDIGQVPVAHAKVQLRSLVNGSVEKTTESNENGEYEFNLTDPGTYVVEMIMVDGYVLALSNAGSLARYETMRTVVQLPGRWDSRLFAMTMPQNSANFLGMSAQNTMTAATLSLAVNANIAPIESGEPVSATGTLR